MKRSLLALLLLAAPISADQGYRIVHTYPHDPEGTGLEGQSVIRKVKLETGEVVQEKKLAGYFGEGIVIFGGKLYEMTYTSKICFVYDAQTFKSLTSFIYDTEGWGLTTDGKRLIQSDGTSIIHFRDANFVETGRIEVKDHGRPVQEVNELEWVEGEIYANVWKTEKLVRISPKDGHVLGWINLTGLKEKAESPNIDVLNGIAYDSVGKRLFVTGKNWSKLFEIKLTAPAGKK